MDKIYKDSGVKGMENLIGLLQFIAIISIPLGLIMTMALDDFGISFILFIGCFLRPLQVFQS
jgi:hypothetical protein